MSLLAIDPGSEQSAYVICEGEEIVDKGIVANATMREVIETYACQLGGPQCVIEMVASYGMAVGREVFETVYWIGRFAECWESARGAPAERLVRKDVKMHLCGNNAAKDSNIRQALLDKFGPGKARAVGVKANPGPLYGVSKDVWAALALAVTFEARR